MTSAASRKYCGPIAAGVIRHNALAARIPLLSKAVNGTARNAKCLPRSELELFAVDRPGQHSLEAINGLFVVVVTMCGSRQALRGGNNKFECRDGATEFSLVSKKRTVSGPR